MNDETENEPRQEESQQQRSALRRRRAALGYDGRSERRALRGAARRRKMRTRLWLVTAPAVVVIAAVVVLLVLFGGPDDTQPPSTTSTAAVAKAGGALLTVKQNGVMQAAVVFEGRESGGVVLVVPGLSLLRHDDRFATLIDIQATGDDAAYTSVVESVFGARAQAVASVSWESLQQALVAAGVTTVPASLATQEDDLELAKALQELTAGAGLGVMWQGLGLQGDAAGFRSALEQAAGSVKTWTTVAVTGHLVEGNGFTYIEPDVAVARALLSGTAADSDITIELRNGSGAVGAVEAAAAQLQPLGYEISAGGNAEDFPNVTQTVISFSTGGAAAAARIRALLGVGAVLEDAEMGLDRLTVVLGSDYAPPVSANSVE